MSRFLAAFRAHNGSGTKRGFVPEPRPEYPGNPENSATQGKPGLSAAPEYSSEESGPPENSAAGGFSGEPSAGRGKPGRQNSEPFKGLTDIRDSRDFRDHRGAEIAIPPAALPADRWLDKLSRHILAALADGAEREIDPDGWLLLIRPDGGRLVVAPHIVAELDAAGLLPALPREAARSTYAACARPPCWSDAEDTPKPGDRCACGGRRWWSERTGPPGWCCITCHPPLHLKPEASEVVET